ncbi:MAG: AAA family ATPase, partial [Chloroflexota bacterium]|nr:AAA family ATPase [Chloroflexota bacterium]
MDESTDSAEIALRGPHLLVLVGASGAGKSTWAARSFAPTEIVSTDKCRALVGDREEVQAYSKQAFELFYFLIAKRMELRKTIVADSTALDAGTRRNLLELAHSHGYPAVAIVFSASLDVRRKRNAGRARQVPDDVLVTQQAAFERAIVEIGREGWDATHVLGTEEAAGSAVVRLSADVRSTVAPPYDIVGDVHGCSDELSELLARLGWLRDGQSWSHPEGRTLISLGDLADRGPDVPACFKLWIRLHTEGKALFVPGNHDNRLMRYLQGRQVKTTHGLAASIEQIDALPQPERSALQAAILHLVADAPPYLMLDAGKLVVAHAGIKEEMIGKFSKNIQSFTLYGDVTGEKTPDGWPVRRDWAADYRGNAFIVYGHTPVPKPVPFRKTVNIDQGCIFGGRLTA